jgi:hypothetical protein
MKLDFEIDYHVLASTAQATRKIETLLILFNINAICTV